MIRSKKKIALRHRMQPTLSILQAMLQCPYKAWLLSREPPPAGDVQHEPGATHDKVARMAWQISQSHTGIGPRPSKQLKQAQQLLVNTEQLLNKSEPPPFYKIAHCAACAFRNSCYEKLKEKDCISILAGMTPKVRIRYHNKGITTITQLSHLFRPRRQRSAPKSTGSYLWELKALAIREQKTFVVHAPDLPKTPVSIYLDFEGIPDEGRYYLLGGRMVQAEKPDEHFSYWADHRDQEKACFYQLADRLLQFPHAAIYHFGSYESRVLKQAAKKWPEIFKQQWPAIEQRMVNLLGYLRSHVYPPTYGNGLKELGAFLGFNWHDPGADGFTSIQWRKTWETTRLVSLKKKLIRYNREDCTALYRVHQWFGRLAAGAEPGKVQRVAHMKKHTPYHLHSNPEFGEDFQVISKAAYFDYQRTKIYWRNVPKRQSPAAATLSLKPRQTVRGALAWKPATVHRVVIIPPLKECPHCGHTKLYNSIAAKSSVRQTDLKFTPSGVRQYVTEYRSGSVKCAKCRKRTNNKNLRIMHYGDNLFALAINYYVNYRISNELISRLIQEHYGIWISQMYLVMYKNRWWLRNWEPVAAYTREIVLNSPVVHIDETTIRLARESGYVWVFATTHTVFYHYTPTRETAFLQELLKDYTGIVVSDFFPGYEALKVRRQKCLIHLVRDLNDDLFKNPFDEEYKAMVTAFGKLLRKIIETVDRYGLQTKHLAKHMKDTERFFKGFVAGDHTSELSVKYSKRLKKHWEELWTFLHHDQVPWNNNNAEAAVKAFAQHRRGVKGQMHVRGLNEYLQMLSVAQTCRYRNSSFLDFLRKKKGIWENVPPETLPGYLPFEQARLFMHRLGLQNKTQWIQWKRAGNRPAFIPANPERVYKDKGWGGFGDWVGRVS